MTNKFDNIIVFTDGACSQNGKKTASAGIGICFPNKEFNNIAEEFTMQPITNQRAELYAIYTALKTITESSKFNKITIYSDSEYSIKSVTEWIKNWEKNNWKTTGNKPVKNQDIIRPLNDILKQYSNLIIFKHVRSHTGKKTFEAIYNDMADKLACSKVQREVIRIKIDTSNIDDIEISD
ncbi:ribonuclease H [Fadolivirus algeromassiliense]|jgi:ribonuclease HI|uniref:ribonuclease H n=1 Tax=Fadolivirus FV1/VV64 TaxID=3070911 RepID=A0A7D3UTP1_9VIRU|nr:ribonuclease H [Fadolivirus algeromassiliense]QKF93631.1 ribonuclease H [Fadolivirus FV1/VV64]